MQNKKYLENVRSIIAGANECAEHAVTAPPEDQWARIEAVAVMDFDSSCYAETDGIALVSLKSGQAFVVWEWQDTSGHG